MKKNFVVLFLTGLVFLQFGCGGKGANANQTNSSNSSTAATPAANTNANTQAQSTPLPQFTDADTAFAEGNKLFDANKTEMAIEAYNQAVKLNPDLADAYFKLGIAYALIEKQNEIESLNQEIELTPTPTPAKSVKQSKKSSKKDAPVVRTKDSEKAFEKAVTAYKKIVAKNDKDDAAFYNLGRSYNKLDEDEDAEKALRQAVKLKPDDTLYQTELGAILIKLAKYDEAVKALKKALELDADNSEAEELLDKAEAGKKRIDFGSTPKPQQPENGPRSKQTVKPEETDTPETQESPEKEVNKPGEKKPETKPEKKPEKTPEKKPEKKFDKKGGQ
jgi:tetratricopeptide (TPR) repeat protein